jgi:hypothetical protein
MNFEKGKIIATIKDCENDKKRSKKKDNKFLFVDDKANNSIDHYECDYNETIQQLPDKETERSILYITGASGSGKSYYTRNYILEYKKMFPKNNIYVFSSLESDETLDKISKIKRIKFTEKFLLYDFKITDFKDSLVIFDDVDAETNKFKKKKIFDILSMILNTGRHEACSVIFTSHLSCAGNETKLILSEAHSITIFPKNAGNRSLKYLLDSYFGLDKHQINYIKKINSRWVTIIKTYPSVLISEKQAVVLNTITKDDS